MADYILTKDSQWTNDSIGITPSSSEQTVVLHTGGKYVDRDIALKINAVEAFDPSELPEADCDFNCHSGLELVERWNNVVTSTNSNYSNVYVISTATATHTPSLIVNTPGYLSNNMTADSGSDTKQQYVFINGVALYKDKNFDIKLKNDSGVTVSTFTMTNDINGNLLIH